MCSVLAYKGTSWHSHTARDDSGCGRGKSARIHIGGKLTSNPSRDRGPSKPRSAAYTFPPSFVLHHVHPDRILIRTQRRRLSSDALISGLLLSVPFALVLNPGSKETVTSSQACVSRFSAAVQPGSNPEALLFLEGDTPYGRGY